MKAKLIVFSMTFGTTLVGLAAKAYAGGFFRR